MGGYRRSYSAFRAHRSPAAVTRSSATPRSEISARADRRGANPDRPDPDRWVPTCRMEPTHGHLDRHRHRTDSPSDEHHLSGPREHPRRRDRKTAWPAGRHNRCVDALRPIPTGTRRGVRPRVVRVWLAIAVLPPCDYGRRARAGLRGPAFTRDHGGADDCDDADRRRHRRCGRNRLDRRPR